MDHELQNKEVRQLVDRLFRHETGKLTAVLTRIFGSYNLELAEDVVQDTLLEAIKVWNYKGVPENSKAWLYKVAKNKALNIVNREKYKREYRFEAAHFLRSEWTAEPALNHFFSDAEIQDDQLRMIFTCCHPAISRDSQIALALKTLCGFSIPEIGKAFLTSIENINKRLVRARQSIREAEIPFEVPTGRDLEARLQTVLETIYLLFNEGYSASKGNDVIRYELCEEAIRLGEILVADNTIKHKTSIFALLALMELNASRFNARQDADGNILTLEEQNRSLWDFHLMQNGFINLEKALNSDQLSMYHILATISAYHCSAADYESTNWNAILGLYDTLIQMDNSPVVMLNYAIAVSKVKGAEKALIEMEKIKDASSLKSYHLFYSAQAAFYIELERYEIAIPILEKAIDMAPLPSEKLLLRKKLEFCREKKV